MSWAGPGRVALTYSEDSVWRNRDTFIRGRAEIIAVRFQYECHDHAGQWLPVR